MVKLAPSLLAADFTRLAADVQAAETAGADWLHLDIMDGQFVPNISFGPLVLEALRPVTSLWFDVHLMINTPDHFLEAFAKAGAQSLTVHWEACSHLHRTVHHIKELGLRAGVALNPATPTSVLADIIFDLDLVLVMTVNPGYGGQRFIPHSNTKVAQLRQWLNEIGARVDIEVDGGIDKDTVGPIVNAGATILVAGSAIFNQHASVAENVQRLQAAYEG